MKELICYQIPLFSLDKSKISTHKESGNAFNLVSAHTKKQQEQSLQKLMVEPAPLRFKLQVFNFFEGAIIMQFFNILSWNILLYI